MLIISEYSKDRIDSELLGDIVVVFSSFAVSSSLLLLLLSPYTFLGNYLREDVHDTV
jgi:hypothetical protein